MVIDQILKPGKHTELSFANGSTYALVNVLLISQLSLKVHVRVINHNILTTCS